MTLAFLLALLAFMVWACVYVAVRRTWWSDEIDAVVFLNDLQARPEHRRPSPHPRPGHWIRAADEATTMPSDHVRDWVRLQVSSALMTEPGVRASIAAGTLSSAVRTLAAVIPMPDTPTVRDRIVATSIPVSISVRARDGAACRYCGKITRSKQARPIRGVDRTRLSIDTIVITCDPCFDDDDRVLRPVPIRPLYSKATADWLTACGIPTEPTPVPGLAEMLDGWS